MFYSHDLCNLLTACSTGTCTDSGHQGVKKSSSKHVMLHTILKETIRSNKVQIIQYRDTSMSIYGIRSACFRQKKMFKNVFEDFWSAVQSKH